MLEERGRGERRSPHRARTRAAAPARGRHEQAGQRVADDVGQRLADPHRGVRGEQLVLGARCAAGSRRAPAGRRSRSRDQDEHERVDEQDVRHDRDRDEQDDRRAQQVADDQDFLVVPAVDERAGDRAKSRFGSVAATKTRATASGEPVGRRARRTPARPGGSRSPNRRDQLAGPQRRERAVEGEPDVRVAADALERLRVSAGSGAVIVGAARRLDAARSRRAGAGAERRCGRAPARAAEDESAARARPSPEPGARPAPAGDAADAVRLGSRRVGQAGEPRRRPRPPLAPRARVGTRTTLANRKKPRPSERNTSPIEATFWRNGTGSG